MNKNNALKVISNMKEWALRADTSLLMAGSVGYRSALIRNEEFEKCDDMDCIFIYDDLSQISDCPFFNQDFYQVVCESIPCRADMFSVKITIEDIKISADFVSRDYLTTLSLESIEDISKFRLKLTNAIEVPDNVYTNFYGNKTTYHKIWEDYQGYRIYKLPIHLFVENVFFPGVLLSKYLFNPSSIVLNAEHGHLIEAIQREIMDYCPADGSLCNAYYKCYDFSEETKRFLKSRK